jgi:hypothetical protein
MELTAFKTMPEELIRHIMGYARPTYGYMNELKWVIGHWEEYERRKTLVDTTTYLTWGYREKYHIYGAKFYDPGFKKMLDMKLDSVNDIGYVGMEAIEAREENTNLFDTISEEMLDFINYHNGVLPVY